MSDAVVMAPSATGTRGLSRKVPAFVWVGVCCVVATAGYSGAVPTRALTGFVLPSVVGCSLVGFVLASRGRVVAAVFAGDGVALAWSALVNVMSGQDNGPAARSSFIAGCCAAVAQATVGSGWPSSFVAPVAGLLVGALALGAGGEVRLPAVATVVVVVIALAVVESARRNVVGRGRRRVAVPFVAVLVAALAAAVVVLQAQHDSRRPSVLDRGAVDPTVRSSIPDPFPAPSHRQTSHPATAVAPSSVTTPNVRTSSAPAHRVASQSRRLEWLLAGVLLLLQLLMLAIEARLIAVRWSWRRLRRRLERGSFDDRVVGAWTWLRLRLTAARVPLPPYVSPDEAGSLPATRELPGDAPRRVDRLGQLTASVAFCADRPASADEADEAWQLALASAGDTEAALVKADWWRLLFTTPAAG